MKPPIRKAGVPAQDQQRPAVTKDKLQLKDAVVAYTLTQTQHALGKLRGDFRLFET